MITYRVLLLKYGYITFHLSFLLISRKKAKVSCIQTVNKGLVNYTSHYIVMWRWRHGAQILEHLDFSPDQKAAIPEASLTTINTRNYLLILLSVIVLYRGTKYITCFQTLKKKTRDTVEKSHFDSQEVLRSLFRLPSNY